MVKLTIFFRKPADVDAFEDHFSFQHVPLIGAMPKVVRSSVSRAIGAPRGEAPYHLIHDVYFEDMAALNFALNSAEGRAAGADLAQFARDIASLMFAEVWGEDPFEMGLMNEAETGSEPVPPEPADVAAATVATVASSTAAETANASKQVPIDVSFLERPAGIAVATEVAPEAVAEAVAETPADAPSTLSDAADAAQAVAEAANTSVTPSDTPAPDPEDSPNPQSPSSAETPA